MCERVNVRRADVFPGDPWLPAASGRAANEVGRIPLTFRNRYLRDVSSLHWCTSADVLAGSVWLRLPSRNEEIVKMSLLYGNYLKDRGSRSSFSRNLPDPGLHDLPGRLGQR